MHSPRYLLYVMLNFYALMGVVHFIVLRRRMRDDEQKVAHLYVSKLVLTIGGAIALIHGTPDWFRVIVIGGFSLMLFFSAVRMYQNFSSGTSGTMYDYTVDGMYELLFTGLAIAAITGISCFTWSTEYGMPLFMSVVSGFIGNAFIAFFLGAAHVCYGGTLTMLSIYEPLKEVIPKTLVPTKG